MKCAVCSREARGFGYFNSALRRSDPRRLSGQIPDRWMFCSMRCMNAFSKVMERLTSVQEDAVIDPSDLELAAMRAALAPLGDYVSTIGMDRPLADYCKDCLLYTSKRIRTVKTRMSSKPRSSLTARSTQP